MIYLVYCFIFILIFFFFRLIFIYLNNFINEEFYVAIFLVIFLFTFCFFFLLFYFFFIIFKNYFYYYYLKIFINNIYFFNHLEFKNFDIIIDSFQKLIIDLIEVRKIKSAFELSFVIVSLFFFSFTIIDFFFLSTKNINKEVLVTIDNSNVLFLDEFIKDLVIKCNDLDLVINFILFLSTNNYEFLLHGVL